MGNMKEIDESSIEKGREFKLRLDRSSYKKIDFAKLMGVANAQNISHWYKRGVPSKFAAKAAGYLDCDAHEISEVESPAASTQEPEIMAERRSREIRRMVNDILESSTGNPQLQAVFESQIAALHKMISK